MTLFIIPKTLMFDLSDKIALIVGTKGGIGAAISRFLAEQGATTLILHSLSSADDLERGFLAIFKKHPKIDIALIVDQNLTLVSRVIDKVLPGMKAFKGGRIICFQQEGRSTLLHPLVSFLAREHEGKGVTINTIAIADTEQVSSEQIHQAILHFLLPGNSQLTGVEMVLKPL